jgi:aspartate beta-hydroxylase
MAIMRFRHAPPFGPTNFATLRGDSAVGDPRHQPIWLDSIEAATDDIRAELINVLQEGPAALMPYIDMPAGMPLDQWRELNQSRRWCVYYLWRAGVALPAPSTMLRRVTSARWTCTPIRVSRLPGLAPA